VAVEAPRGPSRRDRPRRGPPHGTGPLGGAFLIPRPLAEEPHCDLMTELPANGDFPSGCYAVPNDDFTGIRTLGVAPHGTVEPSLGIKSGLSFVNPGRLGDLGVEDRGLGNREVGSPSFPSGRLGGRSGRADLAPTSSTVPWGATLANAMV